MREVLEQLRLADSESLHAVLQRAWQVHLARGGGKHVSRSTLVYAAATTDVLVRAVLDASGLQMRVFECALGLPPSPQFEPAEAPSFAVRDSTRAAVEQYAKEFIHRPLDATGLIGFILRDAKGRVVERLREARVDVKRAARRLRELTEGSPELPWIRTDNIPYTGSPLLHDLLGYASQFARERGLGGITTSSLLMAALEFRQGHELTSLAFLREYFGRFVSDEYRARAIEKWFQSFQPSGDSPAVGTIPYVALYESAYAIARRTSARSAIAARHFVGAMIAQTQFPAPTGARELLRTLQIDPAALAREYLNFLERNAPAERPDKMSVWREFLGVRDEAYMPSFHAEALEGEDLLETADDIDAFATLIASRKLAPPLSIGLFGDWGSGKSFFMKRVQAGVAERAARKQPDFYDRIVQIEFNAWHYVEANLWASLTEHIFQNLRLTTEPPGMSAEKRREHLLTKLDQEIADRNAAQLKLEQAESARDRAANELDAKKKAADATAGTVPTVRAKDVWDLVRLDPAVHDELKTTLSELGVPAAAESKEDVRKTLDDLRRTGSRVRLLGTWTVTHPRVLVLLAVLLVLVPFGVAALGELLEPLAGAAAQIMTTAGAVMAWVARQVKRAQPALKRLEDVRVRIDRAVEAAEASRRAELALAEDEVQRAKDEVVAAKQALEASEEKVAEARQELDDLTAGRQLARFIDDRSASDDYRKLLGVLAKVRTDFEKLSVLLDRSIEERTDQAKTEKAAYGLDRIILYIDDLDRCPPARVVEVLQAVHLLLAFKLFVVVVGVDARWVSESLRQKHRTFGPARTGVPGYAAQPHDYLEKIFQVPFWLEPMQPATTATYIRNLLREDIAPEDEVERASAHEVGGRAEAGQTGRAEARPASTTNGTASNTIDDAPKQLAIRDREVEYMESDPIAELVGRSPRTAKRYVNTYRFFRAGVPARRIEEFVAEAGVPEYKRVLLLLAIVVGAPGVSVEVFAELRKADPAVTLADFAAQLGPKLPSNRHRKEWERSIAALESLDARCGQLVDFLPKVARYSFRPPFAEAAARPAPVGPTISIRTDEPARKKKGAAKGALVNPT